MQRQQLESLLKLVPADKEERDQKWGLFRSEKPLVKPLPLLPESKYLAFWKELKMPMAATQYVDALLRKVAELEMLVDPRAAAARRTGPGRRSWTYGLRYKPAEGKQVSPGCPQVTRNFMLPPVQPYIEIKDSGIIALLNSVLLLALFENVDLTKHSIVAAVDETPEDLQTAGESWRHAVAHVLKLLRVKPVKSIPTILSIFAAFMSSSIAALDNSMIGGGWIYLWLQDHALHGRAKKVHKGLFKCLEPIARESTNIITPAHELQTMCLLFVLRQVLSMTLVPDEMLIKLEEQVHRLTFWPDPVGNHALEALDCLLLEKKAPGHAMRKRCWLNDIRLNPQVGRGTQERARVYLLLNAICPRSPALKCLLDCDRAGSVSKEDDTKRLQLLKVLMVQQMLSSSGAPELLTETEAGGVCKLSKPTLSKLYSGLVKLHEEASKMQEVGAAKDHRRVKSLELWNESKQAQPASPPFVLPDSSREMNADSLLPLEYYIMRPEPIWMPHPVETHQSSAHTRYSSSAAEDSIKYAINSRSSGTVPNIHKLLIAGGNGTIHYFLLGYLNLVAAGEVAGGVSDPQKKDVIFYILPTGESNHIASYIAERDLWYDGTIYRPVKSSLPLVPHVGEQDTATTPRRRSDAVPSLMLTRQIENYLLEASCVLKLRVFNCEAWFRDTKGKRFMTTIPFCTRAEIGVSVISTSSISQEQKRLANYQCFPRSPGKERVEGERFADLVSDISIKLRLVYRAADWDGKEIGELQDQQVSVAALVAINIPRAAESRLSCNPSDELLNVCVMDAEATRRQRLKTMDQVVDRASTFKTSKLVIQSVDPNKQFEILVDGEVYGPLVGVRFVPAAHPRDDEAGVSFPVATFWPTHISRIS